jgi:hypothetical protein
MLDKLEQDLASAWGPWEKSPQPQGLAKAQTMLGGIIRLYSLSKPNESFTINTGDIK